MYHYIFYLGNKDGVVSGFVSSLQTAFQVCEGPAQNGCSVPGAIELGASFLLGHGRITFGQRVVL